MLANVAAFLAMISHSEGTDRAPDPYRVCYGYKHTIVSLADHPAVTGEWKGEPLDDLGPAYVGMRSTAAGRYQLIKPTWLTLKAKLYLSDFTGPSQDAAALELLREKGAYDLVKGGQVADAITLCHGIWASLPGSTSGQPQRTFAQLLEAYGAAGGVLV